VKAIRIMLFSLLAATVAGAIALFVTSNVERGPALTFQLLPERHATNDELKIDAAAMVRRLHTIGFSTTQADVSGNSIEVTMYGSRPALIKAMNGALAAAAVVVRPVLCAAPAALPTPQVGSGSAGSASVGSGPAECAARYLLTADALQVDTATGRPTKSVGVDLAIVGLLSTPPANDLASQTVLLPVAPGTGFNGERLVCGPGEVGNADIASAGPSSVSGSSISGGWVVNIDLTTTGEKTFNSLEKRQFHAYVAIDLDGTVVSAKLSEPKSSAFSFTTSDLQIGEGLNRNQAVDLANDLASPLVVPLEIAGAGRS